MSKIISGADAKNAREAGKFSQAAVAAAVGLNRTYYSLYESGRLALTDSQNSSLAKFLHTHDADITPCTEHTSAQAESTSGAEREERSPSSSSMPIQSTRTDHNQPPSPSAARIQIAIKRLKAVEQTATFEQATGRRVPPAIKRALDVLRLLDYPELLELSTQRELSFPSLPSQAEFGTLDQRTQQKIETQFEQAIVCGVIYGKAWHNCSRGQLFEIVRQLRKTFPSSGKLVPFPSALDEFLESPEETINTNSRLRLEMAEHLLSCATTRIAICIRN